MIWIGLVVVLVLIFGLGTVLEATFWTLFLLAAIAVILALLGSSVLRPQRR